MSTFLKSAPLIWPMFLRVAFIRRLLKANMVTMLVYFVAYGLKDDVRVIGLDISE